MNVPIVDERVQRCLWFRVVTAEPLSAIRCEHQPEHEGGHVDPQGNHAGLWIRNFYLQDAAGVPWGDSG